MIKDPEVPNRLLGMMGNDGGWDNAPLIVLTVVCLVFCLIWYVVVMDGHVTHEWMASDLQLYFLLLWPILGYP